MRFPFAGVWHAYQRHQRYSISPFEAIFKDRDAMDLVRRQAHRIHYFYPLFMMTVIIGDTINLYLHYGFDPNPDKLLYFHSLIIKMLPDFFHEQSHVLFFALHLLVFFYSLFLFFDNFPHMTFVLLATKVNDRLQLVFPYRRGHLAQVEPAMIEPIANSYRAFRKRARRLVWAASSEVDIAFFIPTCAVMMWGIYSSNFIRFPSIRQLLCAITCPIYFDHFILAIQGATHFLGQNRLINLKQQYNIRRINKQIMRFVRKDVNFIKIYGKWRYLMERILDVTREIDFFNRFYSRYITTILVLFGFSGCAVSNAILQKGDKAPFLILNVWYFYAALYFSEIFLLNSVSSFTIFLNVKSFKRLRQLQIRLLSGRRLNRLQVVKLELVNEYKLFLQKCAFRLLNSSIISNKLFAFTIFGAIGIFWMRLIRGGLWN